ncbi:MAG: dihydrofolate reductase family protein [Anaerolineaceae bacterium]|nr:dihydrofolate reductase family protein [Anaerolineaceae bacterium]
MRRVRYCVAMSLDGYIAGPNGEADWIVIDPDYDFAELYGEFDTYLVGRKTFESTGGQDRGSMPGARTFVFSPTLRQADHKILTIGGGGFPLVAADQARTRGARRLQGDRKGRPGLLPGTAIEETTAGVVTLRQSTRSPR